MISVTQHALARSPQPDVFNMFESVFRQKIHTVTAWNTREYQADILLVRYEVCGGITEFSVRLLSHLEGPGVARTNFSDRSSSLSESCFAHWKMLLSTLARSASSAPGLGRRAASTIALKYSNAVYGAALAKSPQVLTKVHTELNNVANSIKQNPDVSQFVNNPTLSAKDRKTGLADLFAKIEGSGAKKDPVSDITKNLLAVLSENGRLGETQGVIEGFNDLVSTYKGELTVVVTSASALPKDVLTRLESSLKQSQAGQQAKVLKISNKVSPLILNQIPLLTTISR